MNQEERIKTILKNSQLKHTKARKMVLNEFLEAGNKALSSYEIEKKLPILDRITLYRTLKSFEEVGIIHHIVDISGKSKYALCSDDCSTHQHEDYHAHFFCKQCQKTICLDDVQIPALQLPQNYILEDKQLALSGICGACKED